MYLTAAIFIYERLPRKQMYTISGVNSRKYLFDLGDFKQSDRLKRWQAKFELIDNGK